MSPRLALNCAAAQAFRTIAGGCGRLELVDRADERVRNHAIANPDGVREVSEHRLRPPAEAARDFDCRGDDAVLEKTGSALDGDRVTARKRAHAHTDVGERRPLADPFLELGLRMSGDEDRVDRSGPFQVALKAIEADEDRFRAPLRWSKRELTCLLAPQNIGDPQPDRSSHVVAPAVEELGGDVGRLARAHEQHVVGAGAQLGCQRRAEKRVAAVRRPQIHAVEREKPVVHPVDRDARRARAPLLARDGSVGDDEPGRAVSGVSAEGCPNETA